jgi:hypothetical protein
VGVVAAEGDQLLFVAHQLEEEAAELVGNATLKLSFTQIYAKKVKSVESRTLSRVRCQSWSPAGLCNFQTSMFGRPEVVPPTM